jgi:RNase P subunit RPR2
MPETCPHCDEPVDSERRTPADGRPYEVWRCPDCGEEWRHPEETILDRSLDFSASDSQLSRRESDTDTGW